jgi:hypothetical protein
VPEDETLRRLVRLVPPPEEISSEIDWLEVERGLHSRLPRDYKTLIENYGVGQFDGFIWILHPTTSNRHLRLDVQIELHRQILQNVNETFARPNELTAWAITDNGDTCFWLNRGNSVDPDQWSVVVNEGRGPEWDVTDLPTCAWLEAVLSGRLRVRVFPEDFPSASPTFHAGDQPYY